MKRIWAFLLASAMRFSLVACGGGAIGFGCNADWFADKGWSIPPAGTTC